MAVVKRFESFRVVLLIIGFYIMFKGLQRFIDGLVLFLGYPLVLSSLGFFMVVFVWFPGDSGTHT